MRNLMTDLLNQFLITLLSTTLFFLEIQFLFFVMWCGKISIINLTMVHSPAYFQRLSYARLRFRANVLYPWSAFLSMINNTGYVIIPNEIMPNLIMPNIIELWVKKSEHARHSNKFTPAWENFAVK
jgi:hypothetical protein